MEIPKFNPKPGIPSRALASSRGSNRGKWKPFFDQLVQLEPGSSFESYEVGYSLDKMKELKVVQTTLLGKKKKVYPAGGINPFMGTFIKNDPEHSPDDPTRAYFITWREEDDSAGGQDPESPVETDPTPPSDGIDRSVLSPEQIEVLDGLDRLMHEPIGAGTEQSVS